MTTYNEVRLKSQIKNNGSVELIIDSDDGVVNEVYDNFDEAKQAIQSHEDGGSAVYF